MPNPIDLTGETFGYFTVLERAHNNKDGRTMWLCRCKCGNERIVSGKCLRNGHTKSCGCLAKEINSERSLINRVGEQYGRLTVIERADDYVAPNGKHHVRWLCQCECGNQTIVDAGDLVCGHTQSCGCLRDEKLKEGNIVHGGCYDRLYKVYANMKNRCYNSNSDDFKYYGGRGIKICDEWLSSYTAFKEWAYSNGYDDTAAKGECTIDRKNVDGDYEPSNCRWVSMDIQSKNRRNVIGKT